MPLFFDPVPTFRPSQKLKAVFFRATAAFVYLVVFQSMPRTLPNLCLMWVGLVILKWLDSIFPWSKEACPPTTKTS